MSEFTKGKWFVSDKDTGWVVLVEKPFSTIAIVNTEANAELIASAPTLKQQRNDLLKACKRMLGAMSCDELNNGRVFDDDLRKEVKEEAKAAIANCEKEPA